MKGNVKIYGRPRLNEPTMLAVWPGVGNVAIIVANYLRRNLDFKRLAEIEAAQFFNPIGVLVRDNVIEEPQFPESRFYYLKNREGSDLILFIGDDQPVTKGYELANTVLDVGLKFGVKRVLTVAAALTHMHHSEVSRVWGVATSRLTASRLKKQYELVQGGTLQIAGLNGLLLGVAKERGVEGICLLGEVPMYATRLQNPMAAQAVMEILKLILGVKVDTADLKLLADETREKMKQVVAEAMGEYINYFTEPIWEQGEGEGEDEDEDNEEEEP